jgi:hypothetical protein
MLNSNNTNLYEATTVLGFSVKDIKNVLSVFDMYYDLLGKSPGYDKYISTHVNEETDKYLAEKGISPTLQE